MQSYYDILGITQNASTVQIKAAFRRLAKIYHPDKNPQGQEEFGKILLAYEILIDTSSRKQYDLKLKHGNTENFKSKKSGAAKQKEWGFSDEELKRRQYYKENYKKEYERYAKHVHVTKKNYNEYKYILFAAPLAVGLLMFIINTYEQSTTDEIKTPKKTELVKHDELRYLDDPFTAYFGKEVYDIEANRTFIINNRSPEDAVVVMFDEKNKFLRSMVVKSQLRATVEQLPEKELNIRFMTGKYWSRSKEHKKFNLVGGFTENETYSFLNTRLTNGNSITLDETSLNKMEEIEEKDFFKKN